MTNMRIWDALSKTDPKHTKQFKRAGGFSGTAMKPIWMVKRLTEQFGPAGIGWGMHKPEFQTVPAGEEILCFCTVGLWYREDDKSPPLVVYGVGGDKVLGKNKYGPFTNDEAFKASYTDALSNAMKQIGVGADIHMGLFDDEKYVRDTAREFEKAPVDEDVSAGARRWVATESGVLATLENAEDVKGWNARNAKALKKLQANFEDQYDIIMKVYGTTLERSEAGR
jgi:hypothetical protein